MVRTSWTVGPDLSPTLRPDFLELGLVLEKFLDDLRSGGLGGGGDRRVVFFLVCVVAFPPRSPAFTVDPEEDEVNDSRSAGRP